MTPSNSSDTARRLDAATYAITADTGQFGAQAELLCNSLSATCPDADIVTFVPTDSLPEMNEDVRDTLETQSTVVTGDIPIPDYPISALQQAMVEAAELGDSEYLVALDTDTVVVDVPEIPHDDAELFVRPETLSGEYWTSFESQDDWKHIYDHFDAPAPESGIQCVLGNRIPPFYNAGVVVTSDYEMPYRWLDITRETFEPGVVPRETGFYNDQLALAVLAQTMSTSHLSVDQNYPLSAFVRTPSSVNIIHYGRLYQLSRIFNSDVRETLWSFGFDKGRPSVTETIASALIYGSFQSSRYLSYEVRQKCRQVARSLSPSRLVALEG